jgi:hypothetical protein
VHVMMVSVSKGLFVVVKEAADRRGRGSQKKGPPDKKSAIDGRAMLY